MEIISAKSTIIGLISRGMFWDIFAPWCIKVDMENKRIKIFKRRWYLVGNEEDIYNFYDIKYVHLDNFVFGADIQIRVIWGIYATAKALNKKDAEYIRNVIAGNIE